ncbi:MAG: IclR family transcriptional regulator [Flavobacteriaceae bacterium]
MPKESDVLRIGAKLGQLPGGLEVLPSAESRKGIQSVDIVFSILRALEGAGAALSLSEVARRAGQQSSKVHHYLVSLVRNGVVRQNANGGYDLGPYALQLGLAALGRLDIVERASEAMATFRDETGEACFLSVWGNRGPTIIRYFEGTRPVTVEARAGLVLPLLTSATGQVFLSWLPEAAWRQIADLEHTSSDGSIDIAARRERGRRAGVGLTRGELLPRIAAISSPVFDHEGNLACALTALGLLGDIDIETTGETARHLHRCAEQLSATLGFAGEFPKLG